MLKESKKFLIMAHGHSSAQGRENSLDFVKNSLIYEPDIIELDLRKSADGVLFCFHGSVPFGVLFAYASSVLPFRIIKRLFKPNTAEEIFSFVYNKKRHPIIYLDIKQSNITGQDLKELFQKYPFLKIWLAGYSLKYLKKLRNDLGNKFYYIFNFPVLNLNNFIKRAYGIVDLIHLWYWQCTEENFKIIRKYGLKYAVSSINSFLIGQKRTIRLAKLYRSPWITYDDLRQSRA